MSAAPDGKVPNIKFDGNAPKLDKAQLEFMKIIEQQNLVRVEKLQRIRRNNLITAGILGASVLGIYAYSMLSVQQEDFLDDFEEPKKVSKQ
ncbi:PREDICTED: cytochrome c oxidase assembly factor 3, mitochondrial [Bactrocera latifrons]|uniref:cytochrome c oxidase assembly factor 3, mitochondrial n=1 Tax=Bactrocera latifrons TaxID=174628 RepID=UPI0008DE647A|nr:PREDICTED: cytochrome c oxidase assembly factor 3, mitochondrial [Bactrocera latifrons]